MPDPSRKPPSMGKFVCQTCYPKEPLMTRRVMHCGYEPRETWIGRLKLPVLGPIPYELDECPGSVVRSAGVVEGREAYEALEHGLYPSFNPLDLRVLYEAAMIAKRSFGLHMQERLNKPGP